MKYCRRTLKLLAGLALAWPFVSFSASSVATDGVGLQQQSEQSSVLARIGEKTINWQEFEAAFAQASRQKFYHGKPPEAELAALQREVADKLVNRILLLEEAKRRNIGPDQAEVQKRIAQYDKQYQSSEQWKARRESVLPGLTQRLEEQSILERIEKEVRGVPDPDRAALLTYYRENADLFTEPEQVKVSVILLKVDPSAPSETWIKALEEAKDIRARIEKGADFAEMARQRSADKSAPEGGDMGYLHRGMLPESAETALSALSVGKVTEPIRLLEGVALLRLDDIKAKKLRDFADIQERALGLWRRQHEDLAWKTFLSDLRKKGAVSIDESRFIPLAETSAPSAKAGASGSVK